MALTISVCRLLGLSLLLRVARSIRAGRFSFGLFRSVWDGSLSSGFRFLASRFLSMEPSCLMISSHPRLRLACLASAGREKCCFLKTLLSISDCLSGLLDPHLRSMTRCSCARSCILLFLRWSCLWRYILSFYVFLVDAGASDGFLIESCFV